MRVLSQTGRLSTSANCKDFARDVTTNQWLICLEPENVVRPILVFLKLEIAEIASCIITVREGYLRSDSLKLNKAGPVGRDRRIRLALSSL